MTHRQWSMVVVLGLVAILMASTREGVKVMAEDPSHAKGEAKLYTAYNVWYEKPNRIYAINYHVGAMIPAGTEVAAVKVRDSARKPKITFTTMPDNSEYTVYFRRKFFPGVTLEKLKDRLFTVKTLADRTAELKPAEIEAIRTGQLTEGMCREAVLMARGYPPSHQTASLDAATWYYWENRFVKKVVRFDADGRTIGE